MCAFLWQGCSTPAEQFANADKEVLGILEKRQEQILGEQRLADIKTPYSDRKLADIPPSEIILNRITDGTNLITLPSTGSFHKSRCARISFSFILNLISYA